MTRHMTDYPQYLLVRIINPGTSEEYVVVGTDPTDVDDISFESSVHPKVARYKLISTGEMYHTAPRYVEDLE